MGQAIIEIRGRVFAVESKSGSQLAFIKRTFEKRTNSELDSHAADYAADLERAKFSDALSDGFTIEMCRAHNLANRVQS